MAPHLVRAQSTYKDTRIHSFQHAHTHMHTHIHMHANMHTQSWCIKQCYPELNYSGGQHPVPDLRQYDPASQRPYQVSLSLQSLIRDKKTASQKPYQVILGLQSLI